MLKQNQSGIQNGTGKIKQEGNDFHLTDRRQYTLHSPDGQKPEAHARPSDRCHTSSCDASVHPHSSLLSSVRHPHHRQH